MFRTTRELGLPQGGRGFCQAVKLTGLEGLGRLSLIATAHVRLLADCERPGRCVLLPSARPHESHRDPVHLNAHLCSPVRPRRGREAALEASNEAMASTTR